MTAWEDLVLGDAGHAAGWRTLPGLTSGWLVLRVDAVLAEQGAEPLDLGGELPGLLGQVRVCWVPGGPLPLARGLLSQQLLLPVALRGGLLEVLGLDGGLLLGAGYRDLFVQVTGVGSDPGPLPGRPRAYLRSRPGLSSRVLVQQPDDLL